MGTALALVAAACGGEPPAPRFLGAYKLTVTTAPSWLFTSFTITDGRLEVNEEEPPNHLGVIRLGGSFAFGTSTWNDARCISLTPPADCGPDKSAEDGRRGTFTGTVSEHGCVHLELREVRFPAFGTEQRWQGSVVAGGFDFHSGKAPCYEAVNGFALSTLAQGWADHD